jgi:hypothetical protein
LLSAVAGTDISYTPDTVAVSFRFVTYCPASPYMQHLIEDSFTIEFKTSGETETSLCSAYYQDLMTEGSVGNFTYKVGTGDNNGKEFSKILDIDLAGLDDLKLNHPECADLLYFTLDGMIGGQWTTLWTEEHGVSICMGDDGVIYYGDMDDYTYSEYDYNTADIKYCNNDDDESFWLTKDEDFTKIYAAITQEDFVQ